MAIEWDVIPLSEFLPQELLDFVDAAAEVVGAVAAFLDLIADAVRTAAFLFLAVTNPIIALVQALENEITAFIDDIINAGVFRLPIVPRDVDDLMGSPRFIQTTIDSFVDLADAQRPIFSQSANVVGLTFLTGIEFPILTQKAAAAANQSFFVDADTGEVVGKVNALRSLFDFFIEPMSKLFGTGEFKELEWIKSSDAVDDPGIFQDSSLSRATGVEPDWKEASLASLFPEVSNVLVGLRELIDGLFPGESVSSFVSQIATLIADRADALQKRADELQDLADALADFFDITGVWVFNSGLVGGTDGFRVAMADSVNRPPFEEGRAYTAGITLLAGGPGIDGFVRLLGLDGVKQALEDLEVPEGGQVLLP